MAIGKDSMLEKHDCSTNNASSNKSGIKKNLGQFQLAKTILCFQNGKLCHNFLFNFSLHPTLKVNDVLNWEISSPIHDVLN
jgi:hypothetical protein